MNAKVAKLPPWDSNMTPYRKVVVVVTANVCGVDILQEQRRWPTPLAIHTDMTIAKITFSDRGPEFGVSCLNTVI